MSEGSKKACERLSRLIDGNYKEVSEATGISVYLLKKWGTAEGIGKMKRSQMQTLCEYFNENPSYLAGLVDYRKWIFDYNGDIFEYNNISYDNACKAYVEYLKEKGIIKVAASE